MEFSVRQNGYPRGHGDEFQYSPGQCPSCDAPIRRHPKPMNVDIAADFIFGIFGDLSSSIYIGGAHSLLSRRLRAESEFDEFLEFVTQVDLEGIIDTFLDRYRPDYPGDQHTLEVIPRILAELRAGRLDTRVRSMVAQARANLLAEHERHLAIYEFRRTQGIV